MGYTGNQVGKGDRDRSDLKKYKRAYEDVNFNHVNRPGKSVYQYEGKRRKVTYPKGDE